MKTWEILELKRIQNAPNIRVRHYKVKGRRFYFKKLYDEGVKISKIAKDNNRSNALIRTQIKNCDNYKSKPYKETCDVYAEFKAHYDEAMR
jgi:hypothetical protein